MKISVVISAFNEEKNIEEALKSVKRIADEIIVIDNDSSDLTPSIAKKYTKQVFSQKNDPKKIDLQKNFGFSKATGDWILSIDADERITPELEDEIKSKLDNAPEIVDGFWISRKNIIFGKWIKNEMWWPDFQLKLFRRGKGEFEGGTVHKALVVAGQTQKLENFLLHVNYESISQFISKLNNYTDIEAISLVEAGYKFNWLDAIRFPVDDFVKTFFLQRGYSDGLHGLVLSLLQAFYMETVFAKLWEKNKFEEVVMPDFVDDVRREFIVSSGKISYWYTSIFIRNTKNPLKKTLLKIKRKISSSKINS
ncbi:MAG TPA: glycosyltransferase family 2 protein [Patescibacteria group bacterium]|nr:glycosyltransferase family 2 protein [Patescibacteria group bacterium]